MAKAKGGFATMDKDRQREIARAGGRTAQAKGTGHRWDSDAASVAGKKGGAAKRIKRALDQ